MGDGGMITTNDDELIRDKMQEFNTILFERFLLGVDYKDIKGIDFWVETRDGIRHYKE